jgi:uncharacterized protein (DUF2141 family)
MKKRSLWLLGGVLLLLQLFGGAAFAYNVSGTIFNGTGNASSRVYVVLMQSGQGSAGYGTTIASIPANNSAAFTIRGVPNGNYQVTAFADVNNTGSLHTNDPAISSASFSVNNGDWSVGPLTLSAVSAPTPPTAPDPNKIGIVTTSNGALLTWNGPQAQNGGSGLNAELADRYVIYWGTSPNPGVGTSLGSRNVPASGEYHVFVGGLTPNAQLYFAVQAVNNGGNASAPTGPVTIAARTGGATVTGRVYSGGITKPANAPLYIALVGSGFYIGGVAAPVGDTATWTITGVQPGTYSVYAILDLNNDGFSNLAGYVTGPGMEGSGASPFLAVPPGATTGQAPDITLTAANSKTEVTTSNWNNSSYNLQFRVSGGLKRPVGAVVTSGPNTSVPLDLGLSLGNGNKGGRFDNWGGQGFATRPVVGDAYSVTVTYADGSTETLSPQVTGVVTTLAQPIFPTGSTTAINTNSSLFAWRGVGQMQGYYDYSIGVNSNSPTFNQIWNPQNNNKGSNNIPAWQLFVPYNGDGSASQPSLTSGTYNWNITVNDGFGNQGQNQATFTPQSGGPAISGFTPAGGATGTSVTLNGSGFTGASGVRFGNVTAVFTVISDGQISATVPAFAPVGPITVTAGNVTTASSAVFQATTTFTGYVVAKATGAAVSGATVTIVGSTPPVTATTDGSGFFTITVPSGVPYILDISASGYHDIQSGALFHTATINSPQSLPYALFTDADATALGFSLASKGLIATRVVDWVTTTPIQGATVTATSFLHPDTTYTVVYTGGGTSTASDGRFFVPNVDEGDIVVARPSLPGYGALPRTYLTHIGVVNESSVRLTPLPIVAATPAGGTITANQAITLAVSNAGTGVGYAIFYTTDGSDPKSSPSRINYTSPFLLNQGNVTLNFYAQDTTHGVAGNVSTASFTVTAGTFSLNVNISGSGTVNNTNSGGPALLNCTPTGCSGTYSAGSAFTLHASPSASYTFTGWSGTVSAAGCSGTGDCSFTLNADTTANATFNPMPPVKVSGSPDVFYSTLGTAYTPAGPGSNLTIQAQATTFTENLNLVNPVTLLLLGGYDSSFTSQPGMTTLQGILTVGLGSLTAGNLIVQ